MSADMKSCNQILVNINYILHLPGSLFMVWIKCKTLSKARYLISMHMLLKIMRFVKIINKF